MGYKLNNDEMAVVLKPNYDNDGQLVSFHTGLAIGSEVGDDQHTGQLMMDAALNMAASLVYCTEYPEFEDVLDAYKAEMLKDLFPEQWAEAEAEVDAEEQAAKEAYSGNVVSLTAFTKTQGNA